VVIQKSPKPLTIHGFSQLLPRKAGWPAEIRSFDRDSASNPKRGSLKRRGRLQRLKKRVGLVFPIAGFSFSI